jgi:predicted ABC-type ATPase
MSKKPVVVVIAGPNGAGKSTAAPYLLRDALSLTEFVNADQIAAGLSAYAPQTVAIEAGRIMLKRIKELATAGKSFAFESTLSSRTFARFLLHCKQAGYEVRVFYVVLPTVDLAIERVKLRVQRGGHDIPLDDIQRRFHRSRDNFLNLYKPLADHWSVLDNATGKLDVIASGTSKRTTVKDKSKWQLFSQAQ